MKTFLIFLLSALLAAGAFMSRPSMDEFRTYAAKVGVGSKSNGSSNGNGSNASGQASADGLTYDDYYLWSIVQKDGKTRYVGVFSRWFSRDLVGGK